MIAKGFSLRNLRSRRSPTADPLRASQARVVSAQSFHREDLAISEHSAGGGDGIPSERNGFVAHLQEVIRTARRTCHWLGMEAPVARIVIFTVAVRIQRPELHGCVAAVVWK